MGRRSNRVYWVDMNGRSLHYAFVTLPNEPGIWRLVRPLVLVTTCPECGAGPGVPCLTKTGKHRSSRVHELREDVYERGLRLGTIHRPRPPRQP